jgi:hypothetical protein
VEVGESIIAGVVALFGSGGLVYGAATWFGRHVDRIQKGRDDDRVDHIKVMNDLRIELVTSQSNGVRALELARTTYINQLEAQRLEFVGLVKAKDEVLELTHKQCEERIERMHKAHVDAIKKVSGWAEKRSPSHDDG